MPRFTSPGVITATERKKKKTRKRKIENERNAFYESSMREEKANVSRSRFFLFLFYYANNLLYQAVRFPFV